MNSKLHSKKQKVCTSDLTCFCHRIGQFTNFLFLSFFILFSLKIKMSSMCHAKTDLCKNSYHSWDFNLVRSFSVATNLLILSWKDLLIENWIPGTLRDRKQLVQITITRGSQERLLSANHHRLSSVNSSNIIHEITSEKWCFSSDVIWCEHFI